jgi:hypothetical protein
MCIWIELNGLTEVNFIHAKVNVPKFEKFPFELSCLRMLVLVEEDGGRGTDGGGTGGGADNQVRQLKGRE